MRLFVIANAGGSACVWQDGQMRSAVVGDKRVWGEGGCQVAGLARAMRKKCVPVHTGGGVLDIVGTGGDGANTVNISTGACVLAAACGAKVAKVNLNLNLSLNLNLNLNLYLNPNLNLNPNLKMNLDLSIGELVPESCFTLQCVNC